MRDENDMTHYYHGECRTKVAIREWGVNNKNLIKELRFGDNNDFITYLKIGDSLQIGNSKYTATYEARKALDYLKEVNDTYNQYGEKINITNKVIT